ncbi:hypothetical protein FRC03_004137 [Tulasnella sp. 419]|nr:hypothetical protein FRC02_007700 [Tulasnella sp. 418]KAG8969184.1 hypothetical protein FRC03_004137 [Tulasnella sp. 419]
MAKEGFSSAKLTLPSFIKAPIEGIIGPTCYTSLVENLDYNDVPCLKLTVSKGLGIGIVLGGSIVKLPQIKLILSSRSARGLSFSAFGLELLAYGINLAYFARNRIPFSTYGETFFLTLQNIAIVLLIVHYQPTLTRQDSNKPKVVSLGSLIAASGVALAFVPMSLLTLLQTLTIPLSVISKLPQITSNYKAGSTGQLSAFAVIANIVGCLARVFTTLTEVNDPLVLWGFLLASVVNVVIGLQMWMYWGKDGDFGRLVPTDKVAEKVAESEKRKPVASEYKESPFAPTATPHRPVTPTSPIPRHGSPANTPGSRKWARKVD